MSETGSTEVEKAGSVDLEAGSVPPAKTKSKPKITGEVSVATRHVMQANKSKNTKPELRMRQALRAAGYPGYRLHWKKCAGKPDICYPGRKVAVFVNGCYWHHCPHCNLPVPKKNVDFWVEKFRRNRERDERNLRLLMEDGWDVVVVWECAMKGDRLDGCVADVVRSIELSALGIHGRSIEAGYGCARKWKTWHKRLRH